MKGRIWTVAIGLAAVVALIAVPAAMAAYTSPKLEVVQTATGVTIKASLDPNDDPTASVRIYVPAGTPLPNLGQAPGSVLGPVRAIVKALDLAGADLPLEGQLVVAAPGQVPAEVQAACTQGAEVLATWVMVLTAAGQTLSVPTYMVNNTASAALGPGYIQICLPPPDVPVGTPGRATFGAKVYSAELTINGVFRPPSLGAWIGFWTPYNPGIGSVNAQGTVASPTAIAPGAVTLAAKTAGKGAVVTGTVTQAGQARGGATVTILAGATKAKLTTRKRVRVGSNGRFTTRFKLGTFFRARAVAAGAAAAPLCTQLAPALAPIPCVNPTVNGFNVQSKVVRKKK